MESGRRAGVLRMKVPLGRIEEAHGGSGGVNQGRAGKFRGPVLKFKRGPIL